MAIKAVISIIDDESNRTYVKNQLLAPSHVSEFPGHFEHTRYDFSFHFNIVSDFYMHEPEVYKEGEE